MGWLFYNSQYLDENGEVDRKKEMDSGFATGYEVLRSVMVDTTYYAAIKRDGRVYAYVALTSDDRARGHNFGYKGMDEFSGPVESKCPMNILKLLSPTDNEWANAWRLRCLMHHAAG